MFGLYDRGSTRQSPNGARPITPGEDAKLSRRISITSTEVTREPDHASLRVRCTRLLRLLLRLSGRASGWKAWSGAAEIEPRRYRVYNSQWQTVAAGRKGAVYRAVLRDPGGRRRRQRTRAKESAIFKCRVAPRFDPLRGPPGESQAPRAKAAAWTTRVRQNCLIGTGSDPEPACWFGLAGKP